LESGKERQRAAKSGERAKIAAKSGEERRKGALKKGKTGKNCHWAKKNNKK